MSSHQDEYIFRVRCTTDNSWEDVSVLVPSGDPEPAAPTTCPVDGGHTIDTDRTHLKEVKRPNGPLGHIVSDEGTELTTRSHLNFIGENVTVTDNAGADATDVTITGGGGVNSIDVAINQGSTAYWATASSTYETAASILFRGTGSVGTPTNIKSCNWQDSGVTGALRVYDATNSQVIAEVTGLTSETKTIVDFGAISNLPVGEACFEVQIKRTAGGGSTKTIISNCSIQF